MPIHNAYRVLIAEEDKLVADLLSLVLRELGCEVRITSREDQIRDGMLQWKPDLLLLDLFLPGCSGLDLLREFKILEKQNDRLVPVLVISSLGFREVVDQARESGAVDFVVKPIDLDVFRNKVMKLLA